MNETIPEDPFGCKMLLCHDMGEQLWPVLMETCESLTSPQGPDAPPRLSGPEDVQPPPFCGT